MAFAIKDLTHGQTNALVKNLMDQMGISNSVEAVRRINTGEWVVRPVFTTWKTVTLGDLGSDEETCERLEDAGIHIYNRDKETLGRATFEKDKATLDLVRASVEELGLQSGATTVEVYAAATSRGLTLCPHETVVQLCLQHLDPLPRGEDLRVAMEPVVDSDGVHCIFALEHSVGSHLPHHCPPGLCLGFVNGSAHRQWKDCDHWMFVRPE